MVNENEFFRNVTLNICGHLEIEKGLQASFRYISQHIPAHRIYLEKHEPELGAMRIVAWADGNACARETRLLPYSGEAKATMAQWAEVYRRQEMPGVLVINDSETEPVTRGILQGLGEPPSSAMSLPLVVEDVLVGALAIIAEGQDRYTEEHANLYLTMKEPFFVALSNTFKHEELLRLKDRLEEDNRDLNRELLRISGDEIVGADFGLREVMRQARQVAPTESPVLLTGETGVGKDVIANAIHYSSTRRDGPFITVNSGAIPDTLIDSELFGHEKGAFTGALTRKRGRFERATGGTILLDEIGEMPLEAQVRLLRVLQHREIERVGGTDRIPVDCRIMAATNRDLSEMVREGTFREDLWFRLNVFPIHVPPLRDRISDIPALVHHFLLLKARELKVGETPTLAPGAMDRLKGYSWPGNVRELENLVERAMIIHRGEALDFEGLGTAPGAASPVPWNSAGTDLDLDSVVGAHIRRVLGMTGGKIHGPGGAGELLGMNPNTLRYRMKKLGIPFRKELKSS
jgi:transcriptional regulator with GAF, ATPase, and Fis domain